jgi:cytochrome c553
MRTLNVAIRITSAALAITFAFGLHEAHADGDADKGAKVYKKTGCATCHNADGMGKAKPGSLEKQKGPQIAGLDADYAKTQVMAIQKKERVTETTVDMQRKVATLTEDQIEDVSAYLATLAPKHKGMKQ